MSLALLAGCSDQTPPADGLDDAGRVVLSFSRSGEEAAAPLPEAMDVYVFRGETLAKILHSDPTGETPLKIKNVGDGMVFSTSGIDLDLAEGSTSVADASALMVYCEEGATSAPLFYSGYAVLDDAVYAAGKLDVSMIRSVSRIDVANAAGQGIEVSEVVIENAPSATYVFPTGNVPEAATMRLSQHFDAPFEGVREGLFTIFESAGPVSVRIRGNADGVPLDMTATLSRVERNRIYTLNVVSTGPKVEATFSVKDWEEGDSVEAAPDMGRGIAIDPEYSVIPQGVKVDYATNTITVPSQGAEGLRLAFRADTKIELASTQGLDHGASLTENPLITLDQGYVSSFNLDIAPQGKGRLGYGIVLSLRNALLAQSYDYVEINVEPSPYQIETVMIGGHEWMCFNATSADLDDQIYILDGLDSVEEMYNQRFAESVGNFFQYGRPNPYSPWTSNDPNAVARPEGSAPWVRPQDMPLPEGYHVASFDEWEDLIPAGTTIPSEYVCRAGERIRATVVTLPGTLSTTPSANVNKQNFKMRYVLFESLDSGNKLFVPICSNKSNSTAEVPGNVNGYKYDTRVTYWVSNDRCVWLIDWKTVDGQDGAALSRSNWNYNGFCPVRGIKDAD
jgi:hypothetical protein